MGDFLRGWHRWKKVRVPEGFSIAEVDCTKEVEAMLVALAAAEELARRVEEHKDGTLSCSHCETAAARFRTLAKEARP